MEENQKSSFKVALNYALITAAILIILDLVFYVLDVPSQSNIRIVTWLVYIGGIIWGQKIYRDVHSGGFATYGKTFSVGFTVGFFAALVVAIYTYIFIKFVDQIAITQAMDAAEQKMIQAGNATDEQIEQGLKIAAKFTTPFMISIMALIFSTIGVTVISLITSIFIKKEAN